MTDDLFFPVAERGLYLPLKSGSFQPSGYKALIRAGEDKPIILACVKDSYKLVKHREVYDAIMPMLKQYNVTADTYYDRDGAKGYIDIKFHNVVHLISGSIINFRVIVYNGYGGSSLGAKIGAINSFCTNGMIIGEYESSYRRHTSGLDVSVVQEWVREGLVKWNVANLKWGRWVNTPLAKGVAAQAWAAMAENEQHRDRMDKTLTEKYCPQYGLNLFSIYQTLTDYATHYDDYKSRAVNSNSPHEREMTMLTKAERIMAQLAA